MLKNILCGRNTGHPLGYVYSTDCCPRYVIMHFTTPFFAIIDGERVNGYPGDCLLHKPGDKVTHGPINESSQFINDWMHFDSDTELDSSLFNRIIHPDAHEQLGELIEYINREEAIGDAYSPRLISDTIYKMLAIVGRTPAREKCTDEPELLRFQKIRSYIFSHCAEEWTLEKMASMSGYSVSRFCAIYTKLFSASPMDELLDKRLELAKQLLSMRIYKIGDIAAMCGFSSIHYFSSFFKKRLGASPSSYI